MTNSTIKLTERQVKAIEWNRDYYTKQAEGKHGKRWINNRVNNVISEMEEIAQAGEVTRVKIDVSWKKSRTWGMNPTATIQVWSSNGYNTYVGKASGCGYDKESSAVAQAMNQSPELKKALYKALDKSESKPYGINDYENGVSFAGGVGMSCYRSICDFLGLQWLEEHGKQWDFYSMTK